jgi:glycosyltransferase involved in cell wall biosynthesis
MEKSSSDCFTKQLSVVFLTYNEEFNLPFALKSINPLNVDIYVIDSGSLDRTKEIARNAGAHVHEHAFENYERQLNWALENLPITTPWIMRLDADEWLSVELVNEIKAVLPTLPGDVTGLEINRKVYFWGRWIRHGGFYPSWLLRVWRTGVGKCEERWMDEHMLLDHGRVIRLEHNLVDENRKGLSFWTDKHNRYADREIKDLLALAEGETGESVGGQAGRRRWAKEKLYARSPLFWRALVYWFYRYIILLGFLDGKAGMVFHFLQAFWYRLLVDAKLYEQLYIRPSQPELRQVAASKVQDESAP